MGSTGQFTNSDTLVFGNKIRNFPKFMAMFVSDARKWLIFPKLVGMNTCNLGTRKKGQFLKILDNPGNNILGNPVFNSSKRKRNHM